jgi:hypothetical protein
MLDELETEVRQQGLIFGRIMGGAALPHYGLRRLRGTNPTTPRGTQQRCQTIGIHRPSRPQRCSDSGASADRPQHRMNGARMEVVKHD